jgi:peptidoglycan/xylan/chitin deacetylase (PgdA/CDA1 family)
MLIARIPSLITRSFKRMTWNINGDSKSVYLTFDDGPTPEVTAWVLDKLDEYGAKGTFFCLGRNVDAHHDIFKEIKRRGHSVGNHTYSHMKGYSASNSKYMDDIRLADELIDSKLFRPPYGRILGRQVKEIHPHFKIIMWEVLSVDYNPRVSGEKVVKNVTKNVRPGSIVVFHDSVKASKNLYHALPVVLEYLKKNGYEMKAIPRP